MDTRVVEAFERFLLDQPEESVALAAISALIVGVLESTCNTIMGLQVELKAAVDALCARPQSSIALAAACEVFNRYVTLTISDISDFEQCKARLVSRSEQFAHMAQSARRKISEFGDQFIQDGSVILIHGYSTVVVALLALAAQRKKQFSVVVSEGNDSASVVVEKLGAFNVPVKIIPDCGLARWMHTIDFVLVGAEAVVESGGIINKLGTYQMAIVAKAFGRPMYVAAESYKFARHYPLTQNDVERIVKKHSNDSEEFTRDYTPPEYLTLLFTDLGILTPSAVSDELIKLYYGEIGWS